MEPNLRAPRRTRRTAGALPQQLLLRSKTGTNSAKQRALLGFGEGLVSDLRQVLPPAHTGGPPSGLCLHSDDSLVHRGCVNGAAWNQSGTLLCTGSDDKRVKVWDAGRNFALVDRGTIKTGHRHNIFHVSFVAAASDRQVLSCGADGTLWLSDMAASSDVERGRLMCDQCEGMMFMFEWMPCIPVVLTAQEDGLVHRVDLREPKPELAFASSSRGAVKALAFGHHSEHILAMGGDGACVKLFDIRKLSCSASPARAQVCSLVPEQLCVEGAAGRDDNVSISGLAWSTDGRELLASYHGDQIYAFDTWAPNHRGSVKAFGGHINHDTFLKGVTYFGEDHYVLSGSDSGHIFVWDHETARVLRVIEADEDAVNGIIPHPHLPMFASYGIDSDCKIWSNQLLESPQARRARLEEAKQNVEDVIEHNVVEVVSAEANISADWQFGHGIEPRVFARDSFLERCRNARNSRETAGCDPYPRYPTDLRWTRPDNTLGCSISEVDEIPAWAAAIEAIVRQALEGPESYASTQYEKAELYLLELAKTTFEREQQLSSRQRTVASVERVEQPTEIPRSGDESSDGHAVGDHSSDSDSSSSDSNQLEFEFADGVEEAEAAEEDLRLRRFLQMHWGSASDGTEAQLPGLGHMLLCPSERINELLMSQRIAKQKAVANIQIVDGDVTHLPAAWFTCTPDHVRTEHNEVAVKNEPFNEPGSAAVGHSAKSEPVASLAVGDPVFLHSLSDDRAQFNGWVGTIMDTHDRSGEDKEALYDVFACAIPAQYTSDVECLGGDISHKCWFESQNLSALLGDPKPDGITLGDAIAAGARAGSQSADVHAAAGEEGAQHTSTGSTTGSTIETQTSDRMQEIVRNIDKTRTFTGVRRGRAGGGLLPPRPALKDARCMFMLGLPCDRDRGTRPTDPHSCPVAKSRLQGSKLLDLLRRREYGMVWQALLTLLDGQDRLMMRRRLSCIPAGGPLNSGSEQQELYVPGAGDSEDDSLTDSDESSSADEQQDDISSADEQ